MSLLSWLRNRTTPRAHRGRAQHQNAASRFRPQLEALEDRWLPSTLTVTSAADSGHGSLRAEIAAAHSGDTIVFAPKLDGKTITLTSGELAINKSLTIQGPSASQVTIDAQYKSRVFDISTNQPIVLSDLTISHGQASDISPGGSYGGAILNHSPLTLTGCTIARSLAGFGGAIDNLGTLTANNCDFTGDSIGNWSNGGPYYGGGAILNQATMTLTGCTIQGNGDGHPGTAGAGIDNESMLTVNSCNISGNDGSSAVLNRGTLTISGSTIDGNSGGNGGGILNDRTLTASDCTIDGNTADGYYGGGVCTFGPATLTNCTLSNNRVLYGDQLPSHTGGGGLYAGNTVALTNCTLANNAVAGSGGGIFVRNSVTLTNCTLSGNSAGFVGYADDGGYGGGLYVQRGFSSLNLTNTLVAGNSVKQSASRGRPDIYGVVAAAHHNLVGDANGSSGIVNGVNGNLVGGNGHPVLNADLGPLQNNGGPTETMALLSNSPAIGQAENSKAPASDQRGVTRLDETGETTDIGAFEL